MMRSSAYNRFGVLMGTSARASCPRWLNLRGDALPMRTLIASQGDFCATAHSTAPRGCSLWSTGRCSPRRSPSQSLRRGFGDLRSLDAETRHEALLAEDECIDVVP